MLAMSREDDMSSIEPRPSTPKRRNRRFRYSLGTLLLVMLSTAIVCSLLRSAWELARTEKNAAEELRKLGASTDDWPGWQEILFGRDYAPVVAVKLDSAEQLVAAFEYLKDMPHLEHLELHGTQATDHHLKSLRDLSGIQSLDLSGTLVTDAGLEHVSRLSRLRHLCLENTKVTDDGVKRLQQALPACKIRR